MNNLKKVPTDQYSSGVLRLSLVTIWTFLPFVARSGFSYQQKIKKSDTMFKWKHLQKPKRATKGISISETKTCNEDQQKATNGKWKHTPKTKKSINQELKAFFIPIFIKAWFPFGLLLPSVARFGFCTKKKPKRAMQFSNGNTYKNQSEQQKAKTSNRRHLPVLVFEIELILSQKQERATKGSKKQRTANGNTPQKPKRATKSVFHSHFHSFASTLGLWKVVDIKSNERPEGVSTSNEKQ